MIHFTKILLTFLITHYTIMCLNQVGSKGQSDSTADRTHSLHMIVMHRVPSPASPKCSLYTARSDS